MFRSIPVAKEIRYNFQEWERGASARGSHVITDTAPSKEDINLYSFFSFSFFDGGNLYSLDNTTEATHQIMVHET